MPDRRLVLPLADLGARASRPREFDGPVVLVVPSLLRMLQAAWLGSLGRPPWLTFEDWLRRDLSDGPGADARNWRYDRVVAAWAEAVGPTAVRLAAGDTTVDGTAASPTRTLSWAEVAMVEVLLAELEALGLTGRNATDLLQGGVTKLVRRAVRDEAGPGPCPLPLDLEQQLADTAATMLADAEATGVAIEGDRSALLWTTASGRAEGLVALSAAVDISIGTLERVATWAAREARA